MPSCCISVCGARKNKKLAHLTLHRFPRDVRLKRKWLDAIGVENINLRHKDWYICSLHFEKTCFNTTLDVVRLRDDSIPTIFPFQAKTESKSTLLTGSGTNGTIKDEVPYEDVQYLEDEVPDPLRLSDVPSSSTVISSEQKPHQAANSGRKEVPDKLPMSDIPSTSTDKTSEQTPQQTPYQVAFMRQREVDQNAKIKSLREKCLKKNKRIKCLLEKLRRNSKKIAKLQDTITELRKINNEQIVVIVVDEPSPT